MCLAQTGNLQQRFAGPRQQTHQITLFRGLLNKFRRMRRWPIKPKQPQPRIYFLDRSISCCHSSFETSKAISSKLTSKPDRVVEFQLAVIPILVGGRQPGGRLDSFSEPKRFRCKASPIRADDRRADRRATGRVQ
jgi:hypothetical protein